MKNADNSTKMRTNALIISEFVFGVSVDGCDRTLRMEAFRMEGYEQKSDKPGTLSTDSDQQPVS